ncbi:MAG: bifunctional acetate--CoA ligase family protein/GNAT family N-acetyltransferase [Pseudomonadota bacterium]
MSIRKLQSLFAPASVALIGASDRPHSVGATVLRNLLAGGFAGPVYAVNPRHQKLDGCTVYPDVAALPEAPELAVICTPPATLAGIVAELGRRGTRAAIILTAGLDATQRQALLAAARPTMLRLLGPNCVGLLVPAIGLNASFAHTGARPGRIAFVSQSGALVTGVLDWAAARGIGFSKFISLGEGADVDFGDLLDYLASDPDTGAILLYVEGVRQARKFMSAARAAARSKPTLVLKGGRVAEGARAAASHTGALAGSDQVFDAAIRRAGMLRVFSTEDLFGAVETLARARPLGGERLAILTNGGGPGVLATDALVSGGGQLASLSPASVAALDAMLPATWSRANPVDIIGDAPVERYRQALEWLLGAPGADAVLLLHAPTAIVPSAEIALALAPLVRAAERTVLACWLGGESVLQARRILSEAGAACYDTPEEAVAGFLQLVQYRRNQALLMEVPAAAAGAPPGARAAARAIIDAALGQGRAMLGASESLALLGAYGIAVQATARAASVAAALDQAARIGYPVALKIVSPEVSHKSEVGGVALELGSPEALAAAAGQMQARLAALRPDARFDGFALQAMARRPQAIELIVGVARDPVFGPVILFGQGGVAVELVGDTALALPPLNRVLARDLVGRTRVARLLAGYRGRPPADQAALETLLVRVSQLVAELPELLELDLNPLLADSAGVLVLDARVRLQDGPGGGAALAIRPYPAELEERVAWDGAELLLRPVRPEDGPAHLAFCAALDPEDVRLRMFAPVRALSPAQLARFTQIDYDREMAFIALREGQILGVARVVADPDNCEAEFAITVRSALKGRGLGPLLMARLIAYCRARGTRRMVGEALPYNARLLAMVRKLGFTVRPDASGDSVHLQLALDDGAGSG